MKLETTKHSLRLSHLSVMQQQRALKRLAQDARKYAKDKKVNAESPEANTYDWHRNVRLKREARAYNLIRAYLKGIPYKQVEQSLKPTTITPFRCLEYTSGGTMFSDWNSADLFFDWLEAE